MVGLPSNLQRTYSSSFLSAVTGFLDANEPDITLIGEVEASAHIMIRYDGYSSLRPSQAGSMLYAVLFYEPPPAQITWSLEQSY